jgi:hypothetical protein
MAVNHWRCAFLCYFLLHKQKKVNKTIIILKKALEFFSMIGIWIFNFGDG